jgi:hypothetical protein
LNTVQSYGKCCHGNSSTEKQHFFKLSGSNH